MQELTAQGQEIIQQVAQRHGVSVDAALTMLRALVQGQGTMAQFSHPEFGGSGQWMQGGMTMVGDMFNNVLKGRVDNLCTDLSGLLASQPLFAAPVSNPAQHQGGSSDAGLFTSAADSGVWWPGQFGSPSSVGSQNDSRYAIFPGARRLVIDVGGHVTVYDTLDHQIGGVSQQQGGTASLSFTSQLGLVRVADLPVVSPTGEDSSTGGPTVSQSALTPAEMAEGDIFQQIEKLAALHKRGVLSDQEFTQKKGELLSRI